MSSLSTDILLDEDADKSQAAIIYMGICPRSEDITIPVIFYKPRIIPNNMTVSVEIIAAPHDSTKVLVLTH